MSTDERHDTALSFRAGAGIILQKSTGEVLMCERADAPGHWSFPQGGIEAGESPQDAAEREMEEELGLTGEIPVLVGVYPAWLSYLIPASYGKAAKVGIGQTLLWHVFRWDRKDDSAIVLNEEFSQFMWCKPHLVYGVVTVSPFKVQMYRSLMKWLQEQYL